MNNLIDLTEKTILVTGASSGIGRQAAITLSEAGARVILTARREEQLQETLGMMHGEGHAYYPFNLCELENVELFLKRIVKEHGRMQGLAFCAGITEVRPCKMTTPEILQHVMKTNFYSFFEMACQFAKKKISDEGAKIAVLSSAASIRPGKGQSAYAASKGAIDASVRVLAQEFLARRININCIRPGTVDSPMTQSLSEDGLAHSLEVQPMGLISAKDVATMIAYLLSPVADMITGRGFDIEGGVYL